jgi:ABC-2 type transport system ATP-binding protein
MNLLFSSHILPDVEAVCDYVIVLGGGKLLAQGEIQQLKEIHQQTFDVRLKSDGIAFTDKVLAAGCQAEMQDDVLRVRIPIGSTPRMLWEIAAENNEQIRHLRPQRSTLEEVFLNAVERT